MTEAASWKEWEFDEARGFVEEQLLKLNVRPQEFFGATLKREIELLVASMTLAKVRR